jgi:cysteine synthase B
MPYVIKMSKLALTFEKERPSLLNVGRLEFRMAGNIASYVGNTPLVYLKDLSAEPKVRVYAKAEWHNPSGSVKDRPALSILQEGQRKGLLKAGSTILDATSGNTGISYAMLGASLGYKVKLCVPKNANEERKRLLQLLGAEIVLTDPLEGSDGAIRKAREIYAESPKDYFYGDQYSNPANWLSHYNGTGKEILDQTSGSVTRLICGVGTGGTITGTGKRLKQFNKEIKVIGVQPDSPFHGIEGLKHLESSIKPGVYDPSLIDEMYYVSTDDAQRAVRKIARREGLLVGVSSGAVYSALENAIKHFGEGVYIAIFPDSALRYLSERFMSEQE